MNPEVKKIMDDMGKEALSKDKVLGARIKELQGLAEDLKHSLRSFNATKSNKSLR